MRAGWAAIGIGVGVGVFVALSLAGCSSSDAPAATPTARTASTATATPTPTPTPTATTDFGNGLPLGYSCDELVHPEVITALDKDLEVNTAYRPAATTSAEQAVAIRGSACQWTDPTTGASLIVTAAHPDAPTLAALKTKTASYASPTLAFGNDVSGYVANIQMEAYTRTGYWVTASSSLFADPQKAKPVMAALLESLPG